LLHSQIITVEKQLLETQARQGNEEPSEKEDDENP
jgi:hypothetical protein